MAARRMSQASAGISPNGERMLERRGRVPDGPVHTLDRIYTKENMVRYGQFEAVPCPSGVARITKPEILHGLTGNPGFRRRSVLAWFVAIAEDGETLDNVESNRWSELNRERTKAATEI